MMKLSLFSHIDSSKFTEWFFRSWATLLIWFNTVCGAIKSFLVALLSDYTSTWITSTTIYAISEVISLVTTSFLFIVVFVFLWKGIGTALSKLIEIAFINAGDGIMFLTKTAIHRVFASVAWIFSSIANGIKKVFFG